MKKDGHTVRVRISNEYLNLKFKDIFCLVYSNFSANKILYKVRKLSLFCRYYKKLHEYRRDTNVTMHNFFHQRTLFFKKTKQLKKLKSEST